MLRTAFGWIFLTAVFIAALRTLDKLGIPRATFYRSARFICMSDEKVHHLEQAARCRRLAAQVNDPETVSRLIKLAAEYEARAAKAVRE
jgi:hypothetical protein